MHLTKLPNYLFIYKKGLPCLSPSSVILPQILIERKEPRGNNQSHLTMESLMTLRASPAASPLQTRRLTAGRQRATTSVVRAASSASGAGEPDLSVRVNGLQMPNPFVIGSGPPGTNYTVMKRAFDEGWGGVIAKTVSLALPPSHLPSSRGGSGVAVAELRVVASQCWHPLFGANPWSLKCIWVRSVGRS